MGQLANLLEKQAEALLHRWTERLKQETAPEGTSEPELRDHIPQLLQDLIAALRVDQVPETSAVAKEHGRQRKAVGFDVRALVREYGLLRSLILDAVDMEGLALTSSEVRVLTDWIFNGIAGRVGEHVQQQKKATLAQVETHHEAMHQREVHLATTLASIGDGVIVTDAQARITFLNPVAERLTGWRLSEAQGQPLAGVFRIVNEHTRAPVDSPVERLLREGIVTGLANHILLVRKDGSEVPIDDSAAPIRTPKGELAGVILVFRDVSEKKRAEAEREALLVREQAARAEAQSEREKQHALFMQAPVAIAILEGPRHHFTFANPAYRALVHGQDVVGKPLLEALPDVKDQGFNRLLDQVMVTGETFFGNEVPIKLAHHAEGEGLILNFVYMPKRNAAGQTDGVLMSGWDVTEPVLARQRVEALAEKLRTSEERQRRIVEASGAGLWDLDAVTGGIEADARMVALMGLPVGSAFSLASGLDTLPSAADRQSVAHAVAAALAGENGGRYLTEFRTGGRDGVPERWVESRAQVRFDAEGKAMSLAGAMIDITARKEAEAAQRSLLEALASQRLLGVAFLRGARLEFELANATFEQIVGGREVVGKDLHEVVPELVSQGFETMLTRVLETGEPFMGQELRVSLNRRGNGLEDSYLNAVCQVVRGASGVNDGVLILCHDVTDDVLARGEAQAKEKERAAFEQQLIGIVSHDLRNPLSVILMASQLMTSFEELSRSATKHVVRIHNAADRALRMVRDLLDFTQARLGGGIHIEPRPVDLHQLVGTVMEEVQAAFPSRQLEVHNEGNGQGEWDPDRFAQVVQNLVTNALKYSPPDSPVQVLTRADEGKITLLVHNGGAPIPAEKLPILFEPFQRAVGLVDKVSRSVGLGLYIVKQVVEAHRGTVEVQSTEAEGTTFIVRLPRDGAVPMPERRSSGRSG